MRLVRVWLKTVLAICCAGWAGLAAGHEGDTFRPFVSAGHFQDSNLFRLARSEYSSLPPGYAKQDRYALYQAGINVDWKPGRQQVVASAAKTLIRYARNDFLDFDGDDLQARWNWRLGNRLSGQLGASRVTSQSGFENIGLVDNHERRERRFVRAEWEPHPRWRVGGGLGTLDNTHSAPSQRSQDVRQDNQELNIAYLTRKGSRLGAQLRHLEADYPNMQVMALVPVQYVADNSFRQDEFNLTGEWKLSAKLSLNTQAGWVKRRYDNRLKPTPLPAPSLVDRPDHSGVTARVGADWSPTAKTRVNAAFYQELGGATDINASSVLKRGLNLDAAWLIREKWQMNAGLNFENRDFRGDPGALSGLTRRDDDTTNANLVVRYMPTRAVSLDVGIQAGRRSSNLANEDFRYRTLFVSVRGDF